ncbi:NAD(P)-dependent alcohol dehydrogenase [Streptomyces viridifaciens]|uniref:NAD(P)-dependent alcohol dehydrogenase n=1 Tax=Kitasatospora aureofaciens TaxID=1894 RepID=UPI0004C0DBD0|nr:NAD(P)-dependent alcohol dehydrogenase [Streptomyces viridifaciens]UKZ05336.1 NAD(P)-dependent alcohol dehydrogenase [Streptomyces viridifaciens]
MSTTLALSLPSRGAQFTRTTIERRPLRDDDVRIDIRFAGICHTDLHFGNDDWGTTLFPLVPGHEIAGVVSEVGDAVRTFKVGDRVGVGCIVNSCGECQSCRAGAEQYCAKGFVMTYSNRDYDGTVTLGGYSQSIVVGEQFVLRIPDAIELDVAAPMLCAGVTVYSPLRRWGAGPGKNVAVVGMGGLGHLGVKIAAAMGAEVTLLGHSPSKEADALRFGAKRFVNTADREALTAVGSQFDLIVNTVPTTLDVDAYLGLLRLDGTLVNVGAPDDPTGSYNVFSLLTARRSIAGSSIGGIRETQEMLDFCAERGVTTEIEKISADQVPDAWKNMSAVRYRYVIDIATLSTT